MNNVADVQQHPQDLSLSLPIRSHVRVASLLLYALCTAGLAQPALAGVNQWTPTGVVKEGVPFGVGSVVVDPVTNSTLYALTGSGGVYKSTNSGATWSAINTAPPTTLLVLDHVAPAATPAAIYITGGGGIYKSTNDGDSWVAVNAGFPTIGGVLLAAVNALAMDPVTHSTLYAGLMGSGPAGYGIYKSTNGGTSWYAVNSGLPVEGIIPIALVVDPVTPATVYVILGTSPSTSTVYKSTNGGTNWSALNTGSSIAHIRGLAVDPVTPTTLYATGAGGVLKSVDGGTSWTAANTGLCTMSSPVGDVYVASQLVVDPITPTTLWLDGAGMFKSTNGGTSWINIGNTRANLQTEWLGLWAIDPVTPTRLYRGGSDGKVYSYTDDAASVTQAACSTQPTSAPPTPTPPPSSSSGSSSSGGGGGAIDPALLLLALFGSYALARRRNGGAA